MLVGHSIINYVTGQHRRLMRYDRGVTSVWQGRSLWHELGRVGLGGMPIITRHESLNSGPDNSTKHDSPVPKGGLHFCPKPTGANVKAVVINYRSIMGFMRSVSSFYHGGGGGMKSGCSSVQKLILQPPYRLLLETRWPHRCGTTMDAARC